MKNTLGKVYLFLQKNDFPTDKKLFCFAKIGNKGIKYFCYAWRLLRILTVKPRNNFSSSVCKIVIGELGKSFRYSIFSIKFSQL